MIYNLKVQDLYKSSSLSSLCWAIKYGIVIMENNTFLLIISGPFNFNLIQGMAVEIRINCLTKLQELIIKTSKHIPIIIIFLTILTLLLSVFLRFWKSLDFVKFSSESNIWSIKMVTVNLCGTQLIAFFCHSNYIYKVHIVVSQVEYPIVFGSLRT